MIKANELRVGNWIEVVAKMGNYPMRMTVYNFEPLYNNPDCANPIPLTPEILEAAGFRKYNNAWVPKDYSETDHLKWSFTIWNSEENIYKYNSAEFCPELKYLHQLQNLYFALTGEELPVSL